MFIMFRYFAFMLSLSIHFVAANLRWHTSQHALIQLYNLQMEHFDIFNNYLDMEAKRLEELKSNLGAMYEWHSYLNDSDSQNHINIIKVMTKIYNQLRKLEDLIRNEQYAEVDMVSKKIENYKDVSEYHILHAVGAMRRLQKFFMIPASDMAAGRHNNRNIGDQMNACECYVMLKYCYKEQDMYGAIEWAIETYKKWKNYGQPKCVDIKKLNFYIISSAVYTGFNFTTLLNSNELHSSDDIEKFKRFFLMKNKDMSLLDSEKMMNIFGTYDLYYKFRHLSSEERFRELCQYVAREDGIMPPTRILTKYSKCRYQTKNSSYRLLMPFKEEDISNDPYIKIYHDVLYDNEILNFKKIVSENMVAAKVSKSTGSELVEDHRSAQVSWVYNENASKTLNARIEAFTECSTKTAENYQIVNYGLGGHYVPHFDAFGEFKTSPHGDRFVTVLFYMSDVQNYGSTVFPLLDIISPAEKGAALVWINLNTTDGTKLPESLHGACPVLKGNKWIMTRWLLEDGQNLTYDWKNNYS